MNFFKKLKARKNPQKSNSIDKNLLEDKSNIIPESSNFEWAVLSV